MVLEPFTGISHSDNPSAVMPTSALRTIATIEDTLELYVQESETAVAALAKSNKWHDKFAKSRKS